MEDPYAVAVYLFPSVLTIIALALPWRANGAWFIAVGLIIFAIVLHRHYLIESVQWAFSQEPRNYSDGAPLVFAALLSWVLYGVTIFLPLLGVRALLGLLFRRFFRAL